MTYVIDASVAVEYLLRTAIGLRIADVIEEADLVAPELIDVEVLSVLRRAVLHRRLDAKRAREAVDDLRDWDLERLSHAALLADAWSQRDNVTAYDAMYVAAARAHDATLVTCDGPLARAALPGVVIQNIRVEAQPRRAR